MLDAAVSFQRYAYLGNEFLTWLWYVIDNQQDLLKKSGDDFVSLEIGNRMVLDNNRHNRIERITIKGDEVGLEEAALALQKGAVVTELNVVYRSGSHDWQFTIKGESLGMTSLRTPQTGPIETKEDLEGIVLEKVYLYEKAVDLVRYLFSEFIRQRVSDDWGKRILPEIRKWVAS